MATLDELNDQVADLTTATTDLLEEVVGQKDKLETAASEASSDAASAASSANAAYNSQTISSSEADRAEAAADTASQVSGLDTVEEAVEVALSEYAGVMSEAEARAIQSLNKNKYAASGFVGMGNSYAGSGVHRINEGMWTLPNTAAFANIVTLGRASSPEGTSKTNFAVNHIAGAISNLLGTRDDNPSNLSEFRFLLQQAPDGTEVSDSTGDCRGSGKANLNLKTDIDPKYGDIASDTNEAVARAFEGEVKNGDFRFGGTDWTFTSGAVVSPSVGHINFVVDGSNLRNTNNRTIDTTVGEVYEVEFLIRRNSTESEVTLAVGIGSGTSSVGGSVHVVYPLISAEVGKVTKVRGLVTITSTSQDRPIFHASSSTDGVDFDLFNLSIRRVTEEVVTHPVDLVMLEYYEEELTGRREVMECIQSLSTTFGDTDVPTVLSTRPLSYFQQYDGQFEDPDAQNDQYRCVVWDDLTAEQKRKVSAYMGEKLFIGENGYLVNGRLRARTIRGAGNGDWDVTSSVGYDAVKGPTLRFNSTNRVLAQGTRDTVESFSGFSADNYAMFDFIGDRPKSQGVFSLYTPSDSTAYKGRCFAYVVATVPRANQGAYHPDLNPWGVRKCVRDTPSTQESRLWYETSARKPLTVGNCFEIAAYSGVTGYARDTSGYIGGISGSGHPDGILYDGIVAGGLNGVIDYRMSAYPMDTKEEASKVFRKVVAGTYRGVEKLVRTKVVSFTSSTGVGDAVTCSTDGLSAGDLIHIIDDSGQYIETNIKTVGASFITVQTGFDRPTTGQFVHTKELNLSVSGDFSTQMVIGDPANILLTDALKDGWLGTWCPDFTSREQELTRKLLSHPPVWVKSDNLGVSWETPSMTPDITLNTIDSFMDTTPNRVGVINYNAFASQTVQSTNKPVLNDSSGLGGVWCYNYKSTDGGHGGNLLQESLIGKVGTNNNLAGALYNRMALINEPLNSAGVMGSSGAVHEPTPIHAPLVLVQPNNDSPAVKALWYQTSNSGQVGLNFAYNELVWNDTPPITTITSTNLDENLVAGSIYRVDRVAGTSVMDGGLYLCTSSLSSLGWDSSQWVTGVGGVIKRFDNNTTYLVPFSLGWGDDSTVRIISGQGTYINLNGDSCLYGTNELAIPYGWVSNHARAGTQTEGVDL